MGPRRKACCSGCQIIITEIRTQLAYPFVLWETQNIVSQGPCRKVEWKDPPWVWGETVPSRPLLSCSPSRCLQAAGGIKGCVPRGPSIPGPSGCGQDRGHGFLSLSPAGGSAVQCRARAREGEATAPPSPHWALSEL